MVWYFFGFYIINGMLHGCVEIQNFSSLVEKYFSPLLPSLVKYFSTLKEKFCISMYCLVISSFIVLLSGAKQEKLTLKIPREGIHGIHKTFFLPFDQNDVQ